MSLSHSYQVSSRDSESNTLTAEFRMEPSGVFYAPTGTGVFQAPNSRRSNIQPPETHPKVSPPTPNSSFLFHRNVTSFPALTRQTAATRVSKAPNPLEKCCLE